MTVDDVNKVEVRPMSRTNIDIRIECNRCGFKGHKATDEKCPAKGKLCFKCGGNDHFRQKCRSKKRVRDQETKSIPRISQPSNKREESFAKRKREDTIKFVTNDDYVFCVLTKGIDDEIPCKVGGIEMKAIIDSGSKYNLMDQNTWEQLKAMKVIVRNQRKETDKVFKAYGGHSLSVVGVFEAAIEVKGENEIAEFYVIKGKGKFLIGRDTAILLGVLKIGCEVNKIDNKARNKTFGKIKGIIVDIPIKHGSKPVAQPYRRVPVPLEKAVDDKIDELLEQGIIEKAEGPSNWISPVVVVPKENDVRICIDMRRANEAVERENHPLPTMEDFLPHIAKGKFFTKLDVKNAFHQIEISAKSRDITTFITRKGLFRYTRLMFGITCAPELFQKIMEQILSGCEGVPKLYR